MERSRRHRLPVDPRPNPTGEPGHVVHRRAGLLRAHLQPGVRPGGPAGGQAERSYAVHPRQDSRVWAGRAGQRAAPERPRHGFSNAEELYQPDELRARGHEVRRVRIDAGSAGRAQGEAADGGFVPGVEERFGEEREL
uniref:(northern house mosquito) hypothetical protein n=1 Tax=Culex pipiens TaxID=7175 RepID=A0A8D8FXJ4_CULPI